MSELSLLPLATLLALFAVHALDLGAWAKRGALLAFAVCLVISTLWMGGLVYMLVGLVIVGAAPALLVPILNAVIRAIKADFHREYGKTFGRLPDDQRVRMADMYRRLWPPLKRKS